MFIFILFLICTILLFVITTILFFVFSKNYKENNKDFSLVLGIFVSMCFLFMFALFDSVIQMSTVNKEVIDAAIEKCDSNQGLKSINSNKLLICNNGARFDAIKPEKDN